MSDVCYQTSDIRSVMFFCLMSNESFGMSYVWYQMSDFRPLMSDVWCLMWDVSYLLSDTRRLMSDVWFYVWYQTSDVLSDTRRFSARGTHITSDMCVPTQETQIPSDLCSLTHSDMCSPLWETHIPRDMCSCNTFPSKYVFLYPANTYP